MQHFFEFGGSEMLLKGLLHITVVFMGFMFGVLSGFSGFPHIVLGMQVILQALACSFKGGIGQWWCDCTQWLQHHLYLSASPCFSPHTGSRCQGLLGQHLQTGATSRGASSTSGCGVPPPGEDLLQGLTVSGCHIR